MHGRLLPASLSAEMAARGVRPVCWCMQATMTRKRRSDLVCNELASPGLVVVKEAKNGGPLAATRSSEMVAKGVRQVCWCTPATRTCRRISTLPLAASSATSSHRITSLP